MLLLGCNCVVYVIFVELIFVNPVINVPRIFIPVILSTLIDLNCAFVPVNKLDI